MADAGLFIGWGEVVRGRVQELVVAAVAFDAPDLIGGTGEVHVHDGGAVGMPVRKRVLGCAGQRDHVGQRSRAHVDRGQPQVGTVHVPQHELVLVSRVHHRVAKHTLSR